MNQFSLLFIVLTPIIGAMIVTGDSQQANPIFVNLYYETLCPDCQEFSKAQLCPIWEKLTEYFKIEFIPYGNAETNVSQTGDISINCQHGSSECAGNRLHSCALHVLPYDQSTQFICCMESSPDFATAGPSCAKKLRIDYKSLKKCADGSEGNYLHYLNGLKTSKLDPPHEWVPWILFNGRYDKDDMDKAGNDLISVLCKYFDDPKPRECNEVF